MADCIFCKIADKEIPAHVVWENERFLAFADIKPVNPGHLLIIPKSHVDSVFDLPESLYPEIFEIAKMLSAPLQRAMRAERIGIAIEGFGVAHAHLHLIPLNGPGELDMGRAQPMDREELEKVMEKIKQEIASK